MLISSACKRWHQRAAQSALPETLNRKLGMTCFAWNGKYGELTKTLGQNTLSKTPTYAVTHLRSPCQALLLERRMEHNLQSFMSGACALLGHAWLLSCSASACILCIITKAHPCTHTLGMRSMACPQPALALLLTLLMRRFIT